MSSDVPESVEDSVGEREEDLNFQDPSACYVRKFVLSSGPYSAREKHLC